MDFKPIEKAMRSILMLSKVCSLLAQFFSNPEEIKFGPMETTQVYWFFAASQGGQHS